MSALSEFANQLSEFARLLDNYCLRDPIREANEGLSRAVDEFNAWLQGESRRLDEERTLLEREFGVINRLESELNQSKQKLAELQSRLGDPAQVAAYNQLAVDYNAKAARHREAAATYLPRQDASNARISQFNHEARRRGEAVEERKRKAKAEVEAYRAWFNGRGPEQLSHGINHLFSEVFAHGCRVPADASAVEGLVAGIRRLRHDLALHAMRSQEQCEHGLLLVKAIIAGASADRVEDCCFFADNAASLTTLTPELVAVLGLEDMRGEEVELSLPNGIRVKAPQLVIPSVCVDGCIAEFVKAVVLKESSPGVDGSLGLSFLSRFDFAIHKGKPQHLILKSLQASEVEPRFDVFICHKSQDVESARQVYDVLKKAGYRPFFSPESLSQMDTGDYHKAIDMAIEGARDLIVVCSCRESVSSAWVEAEWRRFDCLILSGRKRGKIVPVLCGDMTVNDLPPALFRYSAVSMPGDPNWQVKLLTVLPRHLR